MRKSYLGYVLGKEFYVLFLKIIIFKNNVSKLKTTFHLI
jgi:hypothetical protein